MAAAAEAKAWPFEEARKIIKRYEKTGYPEAILFETGYGPSGLPHIGTFGEVARTRWCVTLRGAHRWRVKTRLICFSDDMDGMRKVPDNVPNQEMLERYLHKPLTSGARSVRHGSTAFAHHMNGHAAPLPQSFGFEYEFACGDGAITSRAGSTRCCCGLPRTTTTS